MKKSKKIPIQEFNSNSSSKSNLSLESINSFQKSELLYHYDAEMSNIEYPAVPRDAEENEQNISAHFPLFFESQYSRFIPNKLKKDLERYIPNSLLSEVHKDKSVAVELCLVFLSNLSNAYLINEDNGWKILNTSLLRSQVSNTNDDVHKKIISVLLKGTKNSGPIIEVNKHFVQGEYSRGYRLTENYRGKGVKKYDFQTNHVRNILSKNYFKTLNAAIKNPIANNLITLYGNITLPTVEQIKKEARRLVKAGYTTKKGKKLTFLNKHSKEYWKDSEQRSFVEENIELFKRLTEHGYLIPTVSEENAGGRVTDSFNLMPSWIRKLIKINGRKIEEADYTALHPNIAMTVYGGNEKYITHEKVAESLNIKTEKVKVQHLSFFNHQWKNMFISPLFEYYAKDFKLMEGLYKDKMIDYKTTTRKLFKTEVTIMTNVIKRLNEEKIFVMYVYDALYSCNKNINRVREIMNEETIKLGVYTQVKPV